MKNSKFLKSSQVQRDSISKFNRRLIFTLSQVFLMTSSLSACFKTGSSGGISVNTISAQGGGRLSSSSSAATANSGRAGINIGSGSSNLPIGSVNISASSSFTNTVFQSNWQPGAGGSKVTEVAPYFYSWGLNNSAYTFQMQSLTNAFKAGLLPSALYAFITSDGGCGPVGPVGSEEIADAQNYVALGGNLGISFGGGAGTYLEQTCTDQMKLQMVMENIIKSLKVSWIDFDIEGPSYPYDTQATARRNNVLIYLKNKYPNLKISFTLSVAPNYSSTGSIGDASMAILKSTVNAGISFNYVNLMTMDYFGSLKGMTMGEAAIACAEQAVTQLKSILPGVSLAQIYHLIGITPMLGLNDDGTKFTLDDARVVLNYAQAKSIGLLSYWAAQRDQAGSGINSVYSNVNTANYQFFNTFIMARH